MLTKGYIDLHIHTFHSDGYFSPTKIIDLSKTNNTNFIAISDHDTINGLNEFHRNLQPGMIGVDGVEFAVDLVISLFAALANASCTNNLVIK